MNRVRRLTLFASTAVAFGLIHTTHAQVFNNTATTTFNVNMVINDDCTVAANPLVFGSSGVLATNIDEQTTLNVTCTNTTPYNIGLNAGDAAGSTVGNRLMASAGGDGAVGTVAYQLYQDAARSTIWGETQTTDTLGGVGAGTAQTIPVYGRVPVQDTPPPGTYQSTVTATVHF